MVTHRVAGVPAFGVARRLRKKADFAPKFEARKARLRSAWLVSFTFASGEPFGRKNKSLNSNAVRLRTETTIWTPSLTVSSQHIVGFAA
jgi:hypothetical protein